MDVLALDEQQRQSVDEADDVRPAPVEVPADPHLADAEEVVVGRVVEVENAQAPPGRSALVVAVGRLHSVAQQVVLLAVDGDDGLRYHSSGDASHPVVVRLGRQAGVECRHPLAQRPRQHDVAFRYPTQEAVGSEVLVVVRVHRSPAELLFQVAGDRLPDEGVLSVGRICHWVNRSRSKPVTVLLKSPSRLSTVAPLVVGTASTPLHRLAKPRELRLRFACSLSGFHRVSQVGPSVLRPAAFRQPLRAIGTSPGWTLQPPLAERPSTVGERRNRVDLSPVANQIRAWPGLEQPLLAEPSEHHRIPAFSQRSLQPSSRERGERYVRPGHDTEPPANHPARAMFECRRHPFEVSRFEQDSTRHLRYVLATPSSIEQFGLPPPSSSTLPSQWYPAQPG